MNYFCTVIILLATIKLLHFKKISEIYNVSLNGDTTINLHWMIDYNKEILTFEIHLPSNYGWFAFGFSERGNLFPADYCLLWKNLKGKISFQDTFADHQGILHLDKHQDCKNFKIKRHKNITKFMFQRKFDTCDDKDYIIEDGTTHLVWSRGISPLYKVAGLNVTNNLPNSGMVRVQLLKNTNIPNQLPSHVRTLEVFADNVKVPDVETTYWCHVHRLDNNFTRKHHIYQYEAHIPKSSEGVVHHMEVFHCETSGNEDIPLYVGNCFADNRPSKTQVCKKVLAAWAMGAPAFVYPEEAGLPIGGENYALYVMLEVHYNNPTKIANLIDSSGIRLHVSPVLKPMDAGIMELGLEYTDKMAIPPYQESFALSGYCISECTAVSLPTDGITVFGSQLHTHLTGIKVRTRHIRDGKELRELNKDDHYSTHFQEIRRLKLPVKILPGDALVTTCHFNTENRNNVTLGGFSITDEMCVNYVHYFPKSELEVCKSSISDQALHTYFTYMSEWEGQNTLTSVTSENYQNIEWNKVRVQLLDDVYKEAPLSMQCNMSNGDRFPGYWENAPITTVLTPLPPLSRQCKL